MKKGLIIVSKCQCCYHIENLNHVFINGPIATKVWIYFDNIFNVITSFHYDSITSLLKDWFLPIKGHIRNLIPIIICWYLWEIRNNSKHENIGMNALNVIAKVKNKVLQLFVAKLITVDSFKNCIPAANDLGLKFIVQLIIKTEKLVYWKRPVYGCFKLNMDGSYNNSTAGCGCIIRDYNGMVVAAYAGPSSGTNAVQAETDSLLYGIQLRSSLGITNIWVEVDALLLLHYINGNSISNPTIFYKVRDIKHCFSPINYSLSHILREGNAVADGLAKMECSMTDFLHFNDNSLPRDIKGLIKLDQMGFPYIRFN
ncbi:uncharacterized protein LOC110095807 [Dendrobium catenatum]|uniref:Ribonuclease H protein n=1 Tax=Dendrobium catenatum TaxID=906689 RepID=A0A2I0V9T7_9ASPA|nr:uncharacterized protein LOC110095807 [Dendrobium catenatum]PKU60176.1 Putative ribonuclease H protein [Dendrobium catenatum]